MLCFKVIEDISDRMSQCLRSWRFAATANFTQWEGFVTRMSHSYAAMSQREEPNRAILLLHEDFWLQMLVTHCPCEILSNHSKLAFSIADSSLILESLFLVNLTIASNDREYMDATLCWPFFKFQNKICWQRRVSSGQTSRFDVKA